MALIKAEQIEGLVENDVVVENEYADIATMLADQGNQTSTFLQYVTDASADPTVTSGEMYYEKLASSTATLADDYRKLSDGEIEVIQKGTQRIKDALGASFKAKLKTVYGAGFAATKRKDGGYDLALSDRLLEVGNTGATLSLDFAEYDLWRGVVDEAVTISIANGKPKVVTVDLTGDFAITYPTNSTVVGDTYDGTQNNTLTIHYIDSTNILIIVSVWANLGIEVGSAELKAELKATVDLGNVVTTQDVDWDLGIHFLLTMTGATTLTFSNVLQGKTITLEVDGNFVLTLPTGFSATALDDFDGTLTNYIQVYCANSSSPIYLSGLEAR